MPDPESSAAGRALQAHRPRVAYTCVECGTPFTSAAHSQYGPPRFCGGRCKQRALRRVYKARACGQVEHELGS